MPRGLGKGLEGLFEDNLIEEESADREFMRVRISEVEPNRDQPRKIFDKDGIEELSASIAEHGILQPITVRKLPDGRYQIISGERRWRAARMAGVTEIPIIVREDVGDREALELGLIENLQREDLNAVEEARGYKTLSETFSLTQDQIASRVGKSRSAVANAMRILALPEEVLDMILRGELSAGHARALLPLMEKTTGEELLQTARRIASKGLSVRQTEGLSGPGTARRKKKRDDSADIYYREIEEKLSSAWGRKVSVKPEGSGKTGRGKIIMEYYDFEDLDNLTESMQKHLN